MAGSSRCTIVSVRPIVAFFSFFLFIPGHAMYSRFAIGPLVREKLGTGAFRMRGIGCLTGMGVGFAGISSYLAYFCYIRSLTFGCGVWGCFCFISCFTSGITHYWCCIGRGASI